MTQAPSPAAPPTAPLPLNQGATMPRVGLGVFRASPDEAYAAVREALAAGYRHIDTAQVYGNEQAVGRAVRDSGLLRPGKDGITGAPPRCGRRAGGRLRRSARRRGRPGEAEGGSASRANMFARADSAAKPRPE
jgi:hypothetical protein